MEPEERPVSIYDFLYIDKPRIFSLYAQIFGGVLLFMEKRYGISQNANKSASLKIKFAEVNLGKGQVDFDEMRHMVDPHEVITIDIISKLAEIANSESSKIVLIHGDLVFMDEFLIEIAGQFFEFIESFIEETGQKVSKKERKRIQKINQMLRDFLMKTPMLPAFILESEGNLWGGTLKKEFLSEPISSFYLKYSSQQVTDTYVLGIKEEGKTFVPFSDNLTQIMASLLPGFQQLVFPEGTKTTTPLAIFRKIGNINL